MAAPLLPIRLVTNSLYPLRLADGRVLLIDAGPDFKGAWADLEAQLRLGGIEPGEVATVLVTHAHADHAGLARRWAEAGARVLGGAGDLEALRAGAAGYASASAARSEVLRRHGTPPAVLERIAGRRRTDLRWEGCAEVAAVEDGATFALDGGGALRVLAAPGHTPGNLVALVEGGAGDGDLYSGDTLLPGTIASAGLHFPAGGEGERWASLPAFLDSVERLRGLPVRRVLPAHGEVVAAPQRLFERFEAHHARRAARIRGLLEGGPETAFGLARRLFRRLPEERLAQALVEVIGHLDVLVASGVGVLEERGDGTLAARLV